MLKIFSAISSAISLLNDVCDRAITSHSHSYLINAAQIARGKNMHSCFTQKHISSLYFYFYGDKLI